MLKNLPVLYLAISFFLLCGYQGNTQNNVSFTKYHNYEEVRDALQALHEANPASTAVHNIAASPGGRHVCILEIGKNLNDKPAVFVGANFEGITPIATEGALYLAQMILNSDEYKNLKWFILPLPNPDAAENYFASVKSEKTVNALAVNNDVDELTDEDGFEDLNNDGFITKMRVKDPEGTYIISDKDPRVMVRADAKKGERGLYKIYTEGIDNDGDGQYNEDSPGGVNVGINFPHLFSHKNKEAGLYAGCTPESYEIMKFIYAHPEIAMIQTLGTSDFCLAAPKGGRRGGANMQSLKVPRRFAGMIGADPEKNYTMEEVIEMVKTVVPAGAEVTPSMIAGMMGLGAAVNPQEDDLKFYTKLSEDYKEYLKEKNFSTDRLDAARDKDGSFELWAYYHVGLPSFSMNLFTIPKPKEEKNDEDGLSLDEVEKMDGEEFVKLGEEKIGAFLKANNAPERFSAERVIEMMNSGRLSPKQMAQMMKNMPKASEEGELPEKDKALLSYIDNQMGGEGFVNWETYSHPTLGEVEIGGYAPFIENTPPTGLIDSLCKVQIPWLLKLTENLPDIKILSEKITELGSGVYKVELVVENKGYLPYPTSMGQRNNQPPPVVVLLEGDGIEFLEGKSRTPLGPVGGNQVKKLDWIIKADKGRTITAKIESKPAGTDVKQIKIGG